MEREKGQRNGGGAMRLVEWELRGSSPESVSRAVEVGGARRPGGREREENGAGIWCRQEAGK
jgi:hypothetical protein